jgi:hypothetical protein
MSYGCFGERREHSTSDAAWWNAQLLPSGRCVMGSFEYLDNTGLHHEYSVRKVGGHK